MLPGVSTVSNHLLWVYSPCLSSAFFTSKNAVGSLFVVSLRPANESGFGVLALPEIPQGSL